MANTTNTTNTTFEDAVNEIGTNMMALYDTDAEGNKINLDDQALKAAQETIDEVRKSAIKAFGPLFQRLQDHLDEQQETIGALRAQIVGTSSATIPSDAVPVASKQKLTVVACPDLEWLKANHKGKGTQIKGYNVFCLVYQNVHGCFPSEGIWKKGMSDAEKKPWKDVAKAYSEFRQAGAAAAAAAAAGATAVAAVQPVPPPVVLSDARSAYNLWTSDWKKRPENKTKIFPPKDSWKNLPAAEKAIYEAKFAALKAARAAQKA